MLGNMKPFRLAGNIYYVGTYEECSHLIVTEEGLILIDVGGNHTAQVVLESVETLGFDIRDLKYILLSHGHYDHSDGAPLVVAASGAKVCICAEDEHYLKGYHSDIQLKDGDVIRLGSTAIRCVHTPGHTEGSVCLLVEDAMFSGDTLFEGSCGRTDLPGGDWATILQSLKRLAGMEKNYAVYPGHGPSTTLDDEKKWNPYMRQ